jgi:hypothetical protein
MEPDAEILFKEKQYQLQMNTRITGLWSPLQTAVGCESQNNFYKLVILFSRTRSTKSGNKQFKDDWNLLNRENGLITCKEILKDIYSDLFIHMYESEKRS